MDREEAIRRIKAWNLDSDDMEVLAVVIPELAESEDERTRKHLIKVVELYWGTTNEPGKAEDLAWLEKRKENTWSEEDDAKVGAMCKEGNLKPSERAWLKNLRNRVWKDPQYAIRVTKGFGDPDGPQFELVDLPEEQKQIPANSVGLKEQKPAWSVNDEKNLKSVISTLWFALNTPHFPLNYERIIELEGWLKSLRPPLKDKEMKLKILKYLSTRCSSLEFEEVEDYLNNLRPSWKPSEEQIKAVEHAYNSFPNDCPTKSNLRRLSFDLKELR